MIVVPTPNTPHGYLGFLAGTHELELADLVERIVQRGYAAVLNIGAADGYYAVGLARRLPSSRIVAFEADSRLHNALAAAAALNHVDGRIEIRGRCGVADLARELERESGSTVLVIDIEGGEVEVLDPARVPALASVDMLVETHDNLVPGCTETIVARFAPTHHVERFHGRGRTLSDFPPGFLPVLTHIAPGTLTAMMDERRDVTQEWLFLTAKAADA